MAPRQQLPDLLRRDWGVRAFVEERLTRFVFALPGRALPGTARHVLIAAPGRGNIGDQAMVESFLGGVDGPVSVVVRDAEDVRLAGAGRVEPVALPGLIYGTGMGHLRDVRQFRRMMRNAASLSVVGADIMDGAYNLRASLRRALMAELAASRGVDSRILGFSWNAHPKEAALRALRRASARGAVLMIRDPRSADRARADGLENVRAVADTVFSLAAVDETGAGELLGDVPAGREIALVNVSALIAKKVAQGEDYGAVLRHLHASGFYVVLLPHVSVPGADDVEACRVVWEGADPARTRLVNRILTPAEVKGLCARSAVVVTGRMHLAIMALSAGVPAVTLSSQGKVEGLMSLFDAPFLAVEPRQGMAGDIIGAVDRVVSERGSLRPRIAQRLERVRELSAQNFVGLAP